MDIANDLSANYHAQWSPHSFHFKLWRAKFFNTDLVNLGACLIKFLIEIKQILSVSQVIESQRKDHAQSSPRNIQISCQLNIQPDYQKQRKSEDGQIYLSTAFLNKFYYRTWKFYQHVVSASSSSRADTRRQSDDTVIVVMSYDNPSPLLSNTHCMMPIFRSTR